MKNKYNHFKTFKMIIYIEILDTRKTIKIRERQDKPDFLIIRLNKESKDIEVAFNKKDYWPDDLIKKFPWIGDSFRGILNDVKTHVIIEELIQDNVDLTTFIPQVYLQCLNK